MDRMDCMDPDHSNPKCNSTRAPCINWTRTKNNKKYKVATLEMFQNLKGKVEPLLRLDLLVAEACLSFLDIARILLGSGVTSTHFAPSLEACFQTAEQAILLTKQRARAFEGQDQHLVSDEQALLPVPVVPVPVEPAVPALPTVPAATVKDLTPAVPASSEAEAVEAEAVEDITRTSAMASYNVILALFCAGCVSLAFVAPAPSRPSVMPSQGAVAIEAVGIEVEPSTSVVIILLPPGRPELGLCDCCNVGIQATTPYSSCSGAADSCSGQDSCGLSNLHIPLAGRPCPGGSHSLLLGRHQLHAVHSALRWHAALQVFLGKKNRCATAAQHRGHDLVRW
eukprot:s3748_g6.t2